MTNNNNSLTYAQAGVDIDSGNSLIKKIAPLAKSTFRPEVLTGLGGFGALFEIPMENYKKPILVSGTDGVGTKLKLAMDMGIHDTIGIDLVAMCVNDLIVGGAEPLFFLDYYATGKLSVNMAADVIKGIADGCKISGCSLVGGETAEMPGMYTGNDYDLAGFCVGIVDKENIISGKNISENDILIGVSSSGVHSNGFSLVRKILEVSDTKLTDKFNESTIGEELLIPTKIYVKSILNLIKTVKLKGLSHITGGGLTENIPRIMPDYTLAEINLSSWELPDIFKFLQKNGNVTDLEMLKTFNCGVGLVLCVKNSDVSNVIDILTKNGEISWVIGKIIKSDKSNPVVKYL